MRRHNIPDGVQPVGVARYLSRAWPKLPGWVIRKALKQKDVRVNGARSGADAIVRGGDELMLYIDEKYFEDSLVVLFNDGRLLALEKPAGLPVDADGDEIGEDTLLRRAQAVYPAARLCHRLDTGTGGALLCALDEEMHEILLGAFARQEVKKTYRAIVCGCPEPAADTLENYLVKDEKASRVSVFDAYKPGAKRAALSYRVLDEAYEGRPGFSRVEIDLHTGRTHQIRAQMAHIGHPLLGDDKYGDRAMNGTWRVRHPMLWCVGLRIEGEGGASPYKGMEFRSVDRFHIGERRTET